MSAKVYAVWNWWCDSCAETGDTLDDFRASAEKSADEHNALNHADEVSA